MRLNVIFRWKMLWLISPQKWTLSYRGKNYKEKYLKGSKNCFKLSGFRVIGVIITVTIWGKSKGNQFCLKIVGFELSGFNLLLWKSLISKADSFLFIVWGKRWKQYFFRVGSEVYSRFVGQIYSILTSHSNLALVPP